MNNRMLQSLRHYHRQKKLAILTVFSLLVISQFYSFNHQIQHLQHYSDTICVQCLVTPDYFGCVDNSINKLLDLRPLIHPQSVLNSITIAPPVFYSSRAPPVFS